MAPPTDVPLPIQPYEVQIDARLYDVRGFKHPGGNIIKFLTGESDATEAFKEFHMRSAKARKALAALPSREAPSAVRVQDSKEAARYEKLTKDYAELRRRLEREGWFAPVPSEIVYRLLEVVILNIVGLTLAANYAYLGLGGLGLFLCGVGQGRCGWVMHECGHHSFTGRRSVDIRLQELILGLGCGMSASFWRNQHNKHHAAPQKLKHDVDLETLPLVAFNKAIARRGKSRAQKLWLKLQAITFAPVTCFLVAFGWQVFLHPRFIFRTRHYGDAFWISLRYVLFALYYWWYGFSTAAALGGYFFMLFVGGVYIFSTFALSHSHLDVVPEDRHVHWVEYAATYTVDIKPYWLTDWYMGLLNYQIEHHLFPAMPQCKFPALHAEVCDFLRAHGLPCREMGFWEATRATYQNLWNVGQ